MKKKMAKNIDFSKILKKQHENKWVAVTPDYKKVVAFEENLVALDKKVGDSKVVFMRVLPSGVVFVPSGLNR